MIELDRGKLFEYTGNYAQYLEQKNERLALEDALYAANKNKLKKELDWMVRFECYKEKPSYFFKCLTVSFKATTTTSS